MPLAPDTMSKEPPLPWVRSIHAPHRLPRPLVSAAVPSPPIPSDGRPFASDPPRVPICTCLRIPHPTSSKGVNARYFEMVWRAEQTHNHSPECGMSLKNGLGTVSAQVQLQLQTQTTAILPSSPIAAPPNKEPTLWSLDTLLLEPKPRVRRIRVPLSLLPRRLVPADEAPPPPMPPEGIHRDPSVPLPPGCTCKRISISPSNGFEGLGGYIDRVRVHERDHVHSPWCVKALANGYQSTWSRVQVQLDTHAATATNKVPPLMPTTPIIDFASAVDHSTTNLLQLPADTELALEAKPLLPVDAALAEAAPLQSQADAAHEPLQSQADAAHEPLQLQTDAARALEAELLRSQADAALAHKKEPLQTQANAAREPLQSQTDTAFALEAKLLQSPAEAALAHEIDPLQLQADAAREPLQSQTDAALALEAEFPQSQADAGLARETEPLQSQADVGLTLEATTDATMGQPSINPTADAADADNDTTNTTDTNTTTTPETIIEELMTRTIKELRERLKERGLSSNGPKHKLAVRLAGAT